MGSRSSLEARTRPTQFDRISRSLEMLFSVPYSLKQYWRIVLQGFLQLFGKLFPSQQEPLPDSGSQNECSVLLYVTKLACRKYPAVYKERKNKNTLDCKIGLCLKLCIRFHQALDLTAEVEVAKRQLSRTLRLAVTEVVMIPANTH